MKTKVKKFVKEHKDAILVALGATAATVIYAVVNQKIHDGNKIMSAELWVDDDEEHAILRILHKNGKIQETSAGTLVK